MDDAHQSPAALQTLATSRSEEQLALLRRFPTAFDLRERARKRMPRFAFEYMDGGAGEDTGIKRNWASLDAVELVPRYSRVITPPRSDCTLFGRNYAAPIGIAPIGGASTAFPGAEIHLARAAQAARIPYTLAVFSGIEIEQAVELAPDVLWFQLYRFPNNDHKIGLDLIRRAQAAGVHALVLTIDTPARTVRPREVRSGIVTPFKLTTRLTLDALTSPIWLRAMMRAGVPAFASLSRYMPANISLAEAAAFIQREQGGAFTWEEIAKYRDHWKGPLLLKGILHPADAERALQMDIDGLFVTNHGGRQVDALPASIDVLPTIRAAAGKKVTLILDSGIRSGIDVARAIACGADAAFAGKSLLWSLGALGTEGPRHLINIYSDDLRSSLAQLGCATVEDLADVAVRHPCAWRDEDFQM